jgi:hypothetical protein
MNLFVISRQLGASAMIAFLATFRGGVFIVFAEKQWFFDDFNRSG